jgi:hypothetical protein
MRRIVEEMMETEAIYVQALADIEDVCDTPCLVTRCACFMRALRKKLCCLLSPVQQDVSGNSVGSALILYLSTEISASVPA